MDRFEKEEEIDIRYLPKNIVWRAPQRKEPFKIHWLRYRFYWYETKFWWIHVLKVNSFLNHQMDIELFNVMGIYADNYNILAENKPWGGSVYGKYKFMA